MGKSSRMRTRMARRFALSALAACAAMVVLGAPSASAAGDTFAGTCQNLEGYVYFPDHPLTFDLVDGTMTASLSGGQCSGTLNGSRVDNVPGGITVSIHGLDSCGPAIMDGHYNFMIEGRTIKGAMTYRRVANRTNVLWQGDEGGQAVVELHPLIGEIKEDDPLAGTPVFGPFISGPITNEEAITTCAGAGWSSLKIHLDELVTLPSMSG